MKTILPLFFLIGSIAGWSQTSAYQSSDGNTSIFLENAKASLSFNISDSKFDVGYLHEGAERSLLYGFDITGKPSTDFTSVFQSGQIPSSVGGSASIGLHHWLSKPLAEQNPDSTFALRDDWDLVQFTYTHSSFQTVANATSEPVQQNFNSYRVLLSQNALLATKPFSVLLGVAAGVESKNNTDKLKSVTITTPVLQSAPGVPAFSVIKSNSGFLGAYRQFVGTPIFTDTILIPKKLKVINIDAFTRSDISSPDRYVEGGVGLFLTQSDNVTKVLGGLSVAWKNGAPSIGLVAGFSF
jgi:hypothetical protein